MADVASVQLPLWVEYVKAVGAPFVALIAACIAGGIAYRQSVIARNKLKLDLFEKRFVIYKAAIELIKEMNGSTTVEWDRIREIAPDFGAAPWLLSAEVAHHLEDLVNRSYRLSAKGSVQNVGLTEDQQFMEGYESMKQRNANFKKELRQLNSLFAPYLMVQH
jgi:hypothetical protein